MLVDLFLRGIGELPTFTVLQVGAHATDGGDSKEPFFDFPDRFRGSRVIVCDPDRELCERMNRKREREESAEYYPVALGGADQACSFHLTEDPAWSSLYKPDGAVIRRYQNMNAALPISTVQGATKMIDTFLQSHGVESIDYIKINLPWTGVSLLKGGRKALKRVLGLKVETALVPIYEQQALFGEISAHISSLGFIFDKFGDMYGRAFNPVVLEKDLSHAAHHLWVDSFFLRDIASIKELSSSELLKMALLSDQYGGRDVALLCLMEYDVRHQTSFGKVYAHMDDSKS